MSIESDSDRLDIIQALAGIDRDDVIVRHAGGRFSAIFDEPTQDASFGEFEVEATGPMLTGVRTIDVEQLTKGTPLELIDVHGRQRSFRVEKHEPDGTGMSRVILSL